MYVVLLYYIQLLIAELLPSSASSTSGRNERTVAGNLPHANNLFV